MEKLAYYIVCGIFTLLFTGFFIDWRSFKKKYDADMTCIKNSLGMKKDKADCTKEMDDTWDFVKHHSHDEKSGKVVVG